MGFALKDLVLKKTKALPVSATTVNSDPLELGTGDILANIEIKLSAPVVNTTQLPDTKTNTYSIQTDDNAAFSSATVIHSGCIVQTGAAGAGAAANTFTFRPTVDCESFVRASCVATGSADQTASSMILEILA